MMTPDEYEKQIRQLKRYIDALHEEIESDHSEPKSFSLALKHLPDPKTCKAEEWRIADIEPYPRCVDLGSPHLQVADMQVVPFKLDKLTYNNGEQTAFFESGGWAFFKKDDLITMIDKVQAHTEMECR